MEKGLKGETFPGLSLFLADRKGRNYARHKINLFFSLLAHWNISKKRILHTSIFHLLLNYLKHKKTTTMNAAILVTSG